MIAYVIIVLSLAMLLYWFRSSCVFLLDSNWNEEQARVIAEQYGMSFGTLDGTLTRAGTKSEQDRVMDLLDRDLKIVLDLMSTSENTSASIEVSMLRVYYRGLKLFSRVARTAAAGHSRSALREMSKIVAYMAGEFGEQVAGAGV
jgi:hypothetical protein